MANFRALTIQAGTTTQIQDANSVNVGSGIDASAVQALNVGAVNASSVQLGHVGIQTQVNGSLVQLGGSISMTGNADSNIHTSAGFMAIGGATTLDLDAGTSVNVGGVTATAVAIGHAAITTTVTGGLTQLSGAFSLSGNAASGIQTTAGALGISGFTTLDLDAGANLSVGGTTATAVDIGRAAGTLGFFGTPAKSLFTLTGVLSAVVDPNAQTVLNGIITILSTALGYGLLINGTT